MPGTEKNKTKLSENNGADIAVAERLAVKEKILGMLGFAMKAGKLSVGADKICDDVRRFGFVLEEGAAPKKKYGVVVLASDLSANTKKRICNTCSYYNVNVIQTDIKSDELSRRLGKPGAVAAAATFDRGFIEGIFKAASFKLN